MTLGCYWENAPILVTTILRVNFYRLQLFASKSYMQSRLMEEPANSWVMNHPVSPGLDISRKSQVG